MPTWEEVAEDPKYVGGDLEFTNTRGYMHRGPIASMRVNDGMVYFELEWMAIMDNEGWALAPEEVPPRFNALASWCSPSYISEGRIYFSMPIAGSGTIVPNDGSKLDRSELGDRVFDMDAAFGRD